LRLAFVPRIVFEAGWTIGVSWWGEATMTTGSNTNK
jgi:hypothetical protein